MTKFAISFLIFLSCTQAFSEEVLKVPVKEGFAPLDMSEYQEFEERENNSKNKKKGGVKVITNCVIGSTTYRPGNRGYDDCIKQYNSQKKSADDRGSEMQFNIESGD